MQSRRRVKLAAPKEKHRYIFPNILSKMMKNVSMDVQLESSMMASAFILIGMILMSIYMLVYTPQTVAFKVLLLINLGGAFIFLSSSLVTTYQQYVSYKDVMDFQKSMDMGTQGDSYLDLPINDLKMTPKYNRLNQFLFFGGLLIFIAAFFVPGIIIDNNVNMTPYEYYMLGGMVLLGIFMMYLALKKKKIKPIPIKPVIPVPEAE